MTPGLETTRSARPSVNSFDIFDTLLARRCAHPFNIFYFVEQRSSLKGFTQMRILAERQVAGGDYDLSSIYNAMMSLFKIGREQAEALMRLELQEEYNNLVPIRENCNLVRAGDLLISDMYLPLEFIRRVVDDKAGLPFNPIYLSTHGKSRGAAWKTLSERFEIKAHLGDNQHSDVAMPMRFGIEARLTEVSKLTAAEKYLADSGFEALAWSIREARLSLDIAPQGLRSAALAQIQWSFPLVYLASLVLMRRAQERGWQTLLFSSRDCYLWHRLFEALCASTESGLKSRYFLTSRVARSYPSKAYLGYFESLCAEGPVAIIDICGTGWSLARLIEASKMNEVGIFFLQKVTNKSMTDLYRQLGEISSMPAIDSLVDGIDNSVLEAFNTAPHAMLLDVADIGEHFYPIFSNSNDVQEASAVMLASQQGFELALDKAKRIGGNIVKDMIARVQPDQIQHLARGLAGNAAAMSPVQAMQIAENRPVIEAIAARANRHLAMEPDKGAGVQPSAGPLKQAS